MIITTTPGVEGRQIEQYFDVISADIVETSAKFASPPGWREAEQNLHVFRQQVVVALEAQALQIGADAVVGVQFQLFQMDGQTPLLVVTATGTAVKLL